MNDDFYDYINGSWLSEAVIPEDKSAVGTFDTLNELSIERKKELIAYDYEPNKPGYKSKKLHDTFLHAKENDLKFYDDFVAYIKPALDFDSIDTYFNALEFLDSKAVSVGLIGFGISGDFLDPNLNVLHCAPSGLQLPEKSYYFDDEHKEIREKYVKFVTIFLEKVDKESSLISNYFGTDYANLAKQILDFEKNIAKYHFDAVQNRDILAKNNPKTLSEFSEYYKDYDLVKYLKNAFPIISDTLDKQDQIIVHNLQYLEHFDELINDNNLEILKLNIIYSLFLNSATLIDEDLHIISFNFFSKEFSGATEQKPLWKRALSQILSEDLGIVYCEKYFPDSAKKDMENLVASLLKAYKNAITDAKWLADSTKEEALKKVDTFYPKIGYPSKWRDYSALEVTDNYFQNGINCGEFSQNIELEKFGKPTDKEEWLMSPMEVNAYYYPPDNTIVFPSAILQSPFYSLENSAAQNFGGIGAVIGHEIGHGFDDQGANFDSLGVLRNWWTPEDLEAFGEKTSGLVEQFGGLVPKNLQSETDIKGVIGELTLGENIGDLNGVVISLKALEIFLGHKPTTDELKEFFVNYATIWQFKIRNEAAKTRLNTDPHSPAEFRVNQILKNIDEFYEVYGVKQGDAMYLAPEKRVRIWNAN
ncbi:MAG: M13 family metallopeptidase [Bifidobacteriaceae bacterium]|jgi:predicted metalloendopeptidase|nr:M13 family metallopeptidase [Bifidobacteriaceae bacterium]